MKKFLEKMEKIFAAVPFAEMNEDEGALQIAGLRARRRKNLAASWDRIFAAVTFAEANCPETAEQLLGKRRVSENTLTLDSFLESVGLKGVRVCYGVMNI